MMPRMAAGDGEAAAADPSQLEMIDVALGVLRDAPSPDGTLDDFDEKAGAAAKAADDDRAQQQESARSPSAN